MALIRRFTRLFHADLHAVLDRLEEPRALLSQSLREMEHALESDRQRLAAMHRDRRAAELECNRLDAECARLREELDVCLASAADDLARPLIRRRLQLQAAARLAGQHRERLTDDAGALEGSVADHAGQLESMRQKATLYGDEHGDESDGDAGRDAANAYDAAYAVTDVDVEIALLREKHARGAP